MDHETFGSRLRVARELAGLTQEQLGVGMRPDGADLGKGAISAWETGRSVPDARQIAIIRERLGVSADHLLGSTLESERAEG